MANLHPNAVATASQHLLVLPDLEDPTAVSLTLLGLRFDE